MEKAARLPVAGSLRNSLHAFLHILCSSALSAGHRGICHAMSQWGVEGPFGLQWLVPRARSSCALPPPSSGRAALASHTFQACLEPAVAE